MKSILLVSSIFIVLVVGCWKQPETPVVWTPGGIIQSAEVLQGNFSYAAKTVLKTETGIYIIWGVQSGNFIGCTIDVADKTFLKNGWNVDVRVRINDNTWRYYRLY